MNCNASFWEVGIRITLRHRLRSISSLSDKKSCIVMLQIISDNYNRETQFMRLFRIAEFMTFHKRYVRDCFQQQ